VALEVQAFLGEGYIPSVSDANYAGVVKEALGFLDPVDLIDLQLGRATD
jgi:hypothetical protein